MNWYAYELNNTVVAVPGRTAQSAEKRLLRWKTKRSFEQPHYPMYEDRAFPSFTAIWVKHSNIAVVPTEA